ncbi:MAG: alginate export family protein [Candidatus Omnitrophica bacterium]|nr:alginate export family protein [Candidatus Omnitrophota bacterium]
MRNKVLLAVALAAFMAAPAFAAVQNVKVSGDIDSTYISRNNFNLGNYTFVGAGSQNTRPGLDKQSVFITQTRVRIDADLSDNVSTTVGLINERAWGSDGAGGTSTDSDVDLYLAYATLREFLYSPLTVSVGRQVFHYGNGLVMGDGGVNNAATGPLAGIAADLTKRTAYDGVKAILDYKPLTLDLLYFKNDSGVNTGAQNATKDDSDVFGANANYQLGDAMSTVAEGYFFARTTGDKSTVLAAASDKGDQLYVPGLRVSTNPIKGLNTQAEVAWQLGRKGTTAGTLAGGDNIRRNAMAYQFMASYTLPVYEQYKPMVNAAFTHVSGDKNAGVGRYGAEGVNPIGAFKANSKEVYTAWDPFNEAQGSGTIYNTLFNLTNMNIVAVGGQVTPLEDITAGFTWSNLTADRKYSTQNPLTILQPDGTTANTPATDGGHKGLGNEYDVNVNYAYTEDVTFGVSLGWFVPGNAFSNANDNTASQALAHVLVNF